MTPYATLKTRAVVKPAVELMASLPSVVLGFLAALVFAPFVEQVLPALLTSFVTVPMSFLIGAYIWQLLPQRIAMPSGVIIASFKLNVPSPAAYAA